MRKYLLLLIALCLHIAARGQTEYEYEYWFDNDRSTLQKGHSLMASWNIEANISSLDERLHAIHVHVCDSDSIFSVPVTQYFTKASGLAGMKIRCWFDGDFSTIQEGENTGNVILFDVANLTDGYHTLQIQADGGSGAISAPITKGFVKIPQTIGVEDFTCLCMIDNKVFKQEKVPVGQGIVTWDIDVSSLSQGFHRILIQIVTPSGAASNVWQSFFLRDATLEEFGEFKCVYAFDGAESYTEAGTMTNGNFHFDLDVSSLENGLHQITYMLNNGKGVTTQAQTQFFIKTPLGGNGISEYWYWLNEQDDEQAQKITLPEREETFHLISLLPVESQPIRSKLFQFRVEDGKPVMYARNDIHLRFFDAAGRFTDITEQYVDESVKQEVTNITDLLPTQTINRPDSNSVKWFSFDVAPGDTAAFKLSQPTTVQVFAPSGEEVFKASEAASVKWSGIHTWENGTYYLAVHDVTGSQSTMTLEYVHIGKYAVLSHSPEEVGVMTGNFYIQLYGNGYDKLTKALLQAEGNVLVADVIQVEDMSNATLQFSFPYDNYPRGDYDLVLEFVDEGETERITIEDAVTIADPVFGDIAVEVVSRPAVAKPYPVTVKVRNTGNVTYQFVPLYFANSINQLESVELLNFGIQSSKSVIDAGVKTFYKVRDFLGEDSCIVVPTIIPYLNPYQSMDFQIGFVTGPHAIFNMYAWTETPWSMREAQTPEAMRMGSRKAPPVNITCEIDPCELISMAEIPNPGCICDVLWGSISSIANLEASVYQWRNDKLYEAYGEDFETLGIDWPYQRMPLKSPEDIINQVRRGCVGELLPDELAGIQDAMEDALEQMRDRNQSDCPPPPPHHVNPYMPGDPNDIYGYTSASGCKFVAEDIVNVYYDIEFENDTTIANAAAHHIIVRDTLDARCFDLQSFAPTGISLGSRKITLDGEQNFLKTIDLRPDINVIAQIQLRYDNKKGIATWDFLSLDPMTMEPTDDAMQGILPVNYDGTSGIGEVSFDVNLRPGLSDATHINNRAGIVFDNEEAILTPTWTNIVDAVPPTSRIDNSWMVNDSTLRVTADAFDARSGVWKYTWYVQANENAPWWKEGETESPQFDYHIFEGIDYGFCVLATDSAGNVERKVIERERGFKTYGQDFEDRIDEVNGQSSMVNGQSIYDLSGRRQAVPKENQINIIDKKKVLIR